MNGTLFTLDAFLSPEECTVLIREAERWGFAPAPITTGRGFKMVPEIRNNTRVMADDTELAARLWDRFRQRTDLEPVGDFGPVGLNERFRYYRYTAGQAFRWHRDGAFIRNENEQSFFTFMVYLNDGFDGGRTEFEHESVVPKAGRLLVFDHGLRHQGAEVLRGTKYVLRSDVMFERHGSLAPDQLVTV
jgi:prolyl 4-hydroxylase